MRTTGLLDTGSTETMIPEGIARILGLEMKDSDKTDVTAVCGKTEGWQSKMRIIVEEKHRKHEIAIPACILKSEDLDEIVIGREGFFEAFDITFMEKKKRVKLKPVG